MGVVISQGLIDEMTLVGDGFAPRNPKAKALAVKAAAVQTAVANGTESAVVLETFDIEGESHIVSPDAPAFVLTLAKASPEVLPEFVEKGYMVPVKPKGAAIKALEGNDATEHYEEAVRHIAGAHYDLQNAMGLSSPTARSAAVVATIDSHMASMDALKGGKTGVERKAGRKFSQKTLDRIAAIQEELGALVKNEPDEEAVVDGEPVVAEETEAEKAAKLIAVEPAVPTPAEEANGAVPDPKVEAAKGGVVTSASAPLQSSFGMLQADSLKPAVTPEIIAAIAAAVKASITIPDNSAALTEIASKMDTLATRVEAVEGTVTVTSAKAAANETMLQAAVGSVMKPIAPGGVATLMEDGSFAAPAGSGVHTRGAKATTVKLSPDMQALDGVRAIQEANKAARGL